MKPDEPAAEPRFASSPDAADGVVAQLLAHNVLLDTVARLVRELLGLRTIIVARPTPPTGVLGVVAVVRDAGAPHPSAVAAASLAAACWPAVRTTLRPVVVPDASRDARLGQLAACRQLGIRGFAAIPIVAPDGSCWGVLCAVGRRACPPSSGAAGQVQVLARVVAVQFDRERAAHLRGAELVATTAQHELNNALAKVGLRAQLLAGDPDLPAASRSSVDALQRSLRRTAAALRRFRQRTLPGSVGERPALDAAAGSPPPDRWLS